MRKEDDEARARDRERLIVAVKEGTEFSGVIARSNEMLARRRERVVSKLMHTVFLALAVTAVHF